MHSLLGSAIAGVAAFILCLVFTPLTIKLAHKKGWVVKPRADRWHQKTTALMGGIAIFAAYSIAIFISGVHSNLMLYGISFVMFATGLIDDLWELKPVIKLLTQIACSFVLIYYGFNFGGGLLEWMGIPLTFIWVIGITNAINLLDNMDGLAAGISAIVALTTGTLASLNGDSYLAISGFALAGATIGFLVFNFKPAKIFMGDSGSLFLGCTLAYQSIAVQYKMGSSSAIWVLFIPISLMAIPIMDTTLVTIKRLLAGRRIDQGGRDHTSHRLVALGLSEKQAVLILYGICAAWGLLCLFMYKSQINRLLLCVIIVSASSVIFSVLLSRVKVYSDKEEKLTNQRLRGQSAPSNTTLQFLIAQRKLILGMFIDILIIYVSFRFAKKALHLKNVNENVILAAFICVKISLLYISRLYYRIWRYVQVLEIGAYFISIFLADIILAGLLVLKGKAGTYTFYFFPVDFLVTSTGIVFSRLFYRWLNDQISRNRASTKKVLIYGAGDSGYLLIQELLQNHKYELKPVGWIDDDETKHNMYLYGYKIYGGKKELGAICEKLQPDMILISTNAIKSGDEAGIRQILNGSNTSIGRFNLNLSFDNGPIATYVQNVHSEYHNPAQQEPLVSG
jgi:UDP-GlcNAc:undecaprenyl-phosphate GlcNAc-1-phosphate transferase